MRQLTLEETHKVLLEIGKEFHRLCVENNIPYYMLGGTMLGAVRHKGFIPWDDDMDFGVERQYIPKLMDLLNTKSKPWYKLKTRYNCKTVYDDFFKFEDIRTIVNDPSIANINEDRGLFIDIFTLDRTNGNKSFFSFNNYVHLVGVINSYRYYNLAALAWWRKGLAVIIRILLFPLKKNTLLDFTLKLLLCKKGDYLSNLYGFWGTKEIFHKSIMGKPQLYSFEDTQLFGAENYDAYLSGLYRDYMKIPDKSKLHIHLNEVYWK